MLQLAVGRWTAAGGGGCRPPPVPQQHPCSWLRTCHGHLGEDAIIPARRLLAARLAPQQRHRNLQTSRLQDHCALQ